MVKEVWEDAMHRTVRETLDDADDIETAMAEMSASWPRPSTFLPELKRDISDYLQRAGFPPPGDIVFHKGRFWCHKLEGERPIGKAVSPGWAFIQKQTEPLSRYHEAANLFLKAIEVESALRCGDIDGVFSHSLLLGIAHNRFKMRWFHLDRITIRKKSEIALRFNNEGRDVANAERARTAQERREIVQRLAKEYMGRNPNCSKTEAANWVFRNWPKDMAVVRPAVNTIRTFVKK